VVTASFSDADVLSATGAARSGPVPGAAFPAVCTDSRALVPGCLFVALRGERFDAHDFLPAAVEGGAAGVVVEQGRAVPEGVAAYAVKDTLAALGSLARHHRRRFQLPLGAVGGSNGKTTTKEMVAAILGTRGPALKTEGNLNNEVGLPLTLFRLSSEHVAGVVELGMNRAGEMTRLALAAEPDAAVITVVQPEHLEGLGSLEGVAAAEGELFRALPAHATAVVNLDDPLVVAQAACVQKRLTFGRASAADVRLAKVESHGRAGLTAHVEVGGTAWPVRLHFLGEHNAQNATAAFALGLALGYRPEECRAGLEAARPYARRLNVVDAPGGVTVIDDCYNANPASMAAALDVLDELAPGGRAFAVLGDMLELGQSEREDHVALGKLAGKKADVLAFFGPRSADGCAADVTGVRRHFTEVEPLVRWLRGLLQPGDVVLVKGSRGMRLERVVAALAGQAAPAGGGHGP
jgi:UDP-N-acetylmuramoyl-tripeptide--D-alanyl-D-alanine ligase